MFAVGLAHVKRACVPCYLVAEIKAKSLPASYGAQLVFLQVSLISGRLGVTLTQMNAPKHHVEVDERTVAALETRAAERGLSVPDPVAEMTSLVASPETVSADDIAELDRPKYGSRAEIPFSRMPALSDGKEASAAFMPSSAVPSNAARCRCAPSRANVKSGISLLLPNCTVDWSDTVTRQRLPSLPSAGA